MIRKRYILSLLLLLATIVHGQRHEVHILAVNDIHAALEGMPQLVAIIDSLRTCYPSLLVFSAGDNITGNPLSDRYEPSSYPIVSLMNLAGFNGSAVGNHEFDTYSLPGLCGLSAFRYICANMTADDSSGVHTVPCQVFDAEGVKVGVVGAVQINANGTPNAHPDMFRGLKFMSPFEAVGHYEWLSRECDVTVLLSHVGYQEDIMLADMYPWLDVIIGGHTHRQLSEKEPLHNGVLVTQNRNLLNRAVHITLTVDSGRVTDKTAEYIMVRSFPKTNKVAEAMVREFTENPYFKRVLSHAEAPFSNRNEIGTMVCDALMDKTGADIALLNYKGIRVTKLPAGGISIGDIYEIDPFGSNIVTLTMKGDELEQFIIKYGQMNTYKFPHLGGMLADVTLDAPGSNDITAVKLRAADGGKFNRKKTYRVVTNSYVIATNKMPLKDTPTVLNASTTDAVIQYLEQHPAVNYQGKSTVRYVTK